MFFVYYADGYWDNGDVGFAEFRTQDDAEAFVSERIAKADKPGPKAYTVVQGVRLEVLPISVVTRVKFGPAATHGA